MQFKYCEQKLQISQNYKDFQARKAAVTQQQLGPSHDNGEINKPTIHIFYSLSDARYCLSSIRNLSERFWLLSKEVLNFQSEVIQLRGKKTETLFFVDKPQIILSVLKVLCQDNKHG